MLPWSNEKKAWGRPHLLGEVLALHLPALRLALRVCQDATRFVTLLDQPLLLHQRRRQLLSQAAHTLEGLLVFLRARARVQGAAQCSGQTIEGNGLCHN